MKQYLDAIHHVMTNGVDKIDRTGIGTRSVFGYQMRFDLQKGFPAVTTKKLAFRAMTAELLWFLEGSTDERRLAELTYGKPRSELIGKRTIWSDNAENQARALGYQVDDKAAHLGPVYGAQWAKSDQIHEILETLREDPHSRRIMLSAWNPEEIGVMALPPCHVLAQFNVTNGYLNCQMYQRSVDVGLGLPFNIASYALLTHLLARESGYRPGEFIHTSGDMHIYKNHFKALEEQVAREPKPLPTLEIDEDFELCYAVIREPKKDGEKLWRGYAPYTIDAAQKIRLVGYEHYETIKMPMAI